MSMDEKAFGVHQEKEGWSDAEDEDNDTSESLSFGKECRSSFI